MLVPNLQPLKDDFMAVISSAGGQMFFSLSLGMGAMITYGSYLEKKENIEKNALIVVCSDTLVAVMAAFAILPAAIALGGEDAAMAGPSLLFVTLQDVFAAMGTLGPVFGLIFYILVFIAAITSAISLVEVVTTFYMDKAHAKGQPATARSTPSSPAWPSSCSPSSSPPTASAPTASGSRSATAGSTSWTSGPRAS